MTSRWQRPDPAVGRPSARAGQRLSTAIAAEIADLEVRLTEAVLRTDAYLEAGEDEAAASVLDEQRVLLRELEERLGAVVAAAAVEREAEAVVAAVDPAPPRPAGPTRVPRSSVVAAAVAAAAALFATLTTVSPPDPAAGLASDLSPSTEDGRLGASTTDGRTPSGAAAVPTDVASRAGAADGGTSDADDEVPAAPPVADLPGTETLSELVQRILGPLGLVELEASIGDALSRLPDRIPAPPPLPARPDEGPPPRPATEAPSDAPAEPQPAPADPAPTPTATDPSSDAPSSADAGEGEGEGEDAVISDGFFQVGD